MNDQFKTTMIADDIYEIARRLREIKKAQSATVSARPMCPDCHDSGVRWISGKAIGRALIKVPCENCEIS